MIIFYFISHWLTHHFGNCGRQSLDLQAFESLQAPETASFLSVVWKGEDTADTYQHVHISLHLFLCFVFIHIHIYIYMIFPQTALELNGVSILARNGLCSLMICWFLLVPAGVPVLVSLLLSSLVPVLVSLLLSSFISSGQGLYSFGCLSPFFSLLWFLVLVSLLLSSFFPQERGSVPSWFAGSSWFRLGFRCLSPFFSLFFPQKRGFVPSWFAGSSWFRLGFRCLSPFFSLLSFLRTGVLFHHDLLVPLGSGWGSGACLPCSLFFGSGACLPSSLFFLSSGKGFCSIMIWWFLLVPAGVPVLVSLLLSSFFPQDRGSVPSWFAGSSWFRLGFRCLSPLLLSSLVPVLVSLLLLSFLRTGRLFHHDLLVPLGSGWGSGACLPSSLFFLSSGKGFCSIMICWFLLVPAGVPVLVSLLLSSFFPQERGSVPSWFAGSSWFRLGFRCLSPFFSLFFPQERAFVPSWFAGSSWFRLGFWCLSPLLLYSLVPVLVSVLLSSFVPQDRGSVPSWFAGSSWFRLGFRCLSPFFSLLWFRCLSPFFSLLSFLRKGAPFYHDLLAPPGSGWGSGACVPSSLFFGSGASLPSSLFFLSSGKGFCPSWFAGSSWFWLGFRCLSPFFSLLSFLRKGGSVPSWFAGSSWFRLGFRCLSPFFSLLWFRCLCPFFSLLSILRKGAPFYHDLLAPPGSGWGSGACVPSSLFFGSGACVPSSLFFLSSGKGFCASWFAGSSRFWLGFRCLSPFFSLLSFLRKGVLFHLDLLVPLGSGWGSGACLPSSLFFISSGKGFCSIMMGWFLLVPAGVPVLVSLLLSSSFPQERGSVPSWRSKTEDRSVPDSSMNFELHMTLALLLFRVYAGVMICLLTLTCLTSRRCPLQTHRGSLIVVDLLQYSAGLSSVFMVFNSLPDASL